MTALPACPSFDAIEASIGRVAERLRGTPVRDIVLLRLIKHLSARFSAHVSQLVRPAGLNEVGFRTMMMLYANAESGMHASELSEAAGETRANMTRICDELSRKGLLRRRPGTTDRRRVVLEISRKGMALIERLLPKLWSELDLRMRALSVRDKLDLERLLKKLAAALDAKEQTA
ncbi:MAG: MarR family transcriptional regulator [Xanthomonadaceae bacterium]|nr:MarR family transcriptional regulator [Xanthomonadaceae bacterium]MDE2083332.1 MarR family transcriptional regulator [Xanthomonadaceae bacterium]